MTERPTTSAGGQAVDEQHSALLSLHARAADHLPDPGLIPGFRRVATGPALRTLAAASTDDVPVSARLGVLGDLARAGFPEWETEEQAYRELADSVASARDGVATDHLLEDLRHSAGEDVRFSTLRSGRALPHEEAAFVGEDVCTVRTVQIGGLEATWVFSEFETDAPFEKVAEWIDPRNWPQRGPLLFKAMDLVGATRPVDLGPPGDVHWHAIFREEVQLVTRVHTLLHCDYWREGDRAAGMTYDLALSLDDEIDVDRGFLLVNDVGPVRRVKALKIVGFKKSLWDTLAGLVCPFWTDWVKAAVQGGGTSTPTTPGPATTTGEDVDSGKDRCPWLDASEEWIDFMGESARSYLDLFEDMGKKAAPGATTKDLADNGRRLFSQLAKDWAQAWTFGLETMGEVAKKGMEEGILPPDSSRTGAQAASSTGPAAAPGAQPAQVSTEATEGTVILLENLATEDSPSVSDLVSIEAGGALIPAGDITTDVETIGGTARGVRLTVPTGSLSPGLYVGQVTSRPEASPVPVQLYISRSSPV
ncbi:hypothetical protein [Ornithinimicrobium sp. LYQ103]|uniref:hypothetical protein n=1 Tax=Ornithinimicrobium sp. LYQ103 TaxID=3378796 RepID=UPI0038550314